MREHLQRRVTRYRPATPMRPAGYGGVGASAALALLPDAHGIALVALPCICPTAFVTRPSRVSQRPAGSREMAQVKAHDERRPRRGPTA